MKIKFWNLGSIKAAELDLRPLTVIIGPNNSNKTYIAYSIYGLWQEIERYYVNLSLMKIRLSRQINQKLELKVVSEENGSFSIDKKQFYELIIQKIKGISKKLQGNYWAAFFQDSSGKIFDKTKLEIEINEDDIQQGVNGFLLLAQEEFRLGRFGINKIEQNDEKFLIYFNEDTETLSITELTH